MIMEHNEIGAVIFLTACVVLLIGNWWEKKVKK